MNAQPISEKPRTGGCVTVGLFVFGLIFFLAGCGGLFGAFLLPFTRSIQARYWLPTTCTIIRSQVETHTDSDGDDSYSPDIEFQYTYEGSLHKSSRYSFHKFSSGRRWVDRIVDQYPTGSQATCYCNPKDPSLAVLDRSFKGSAFWFGLLFPSPFVLVGAAICYFCLAGNRWLPKSNEKPSKSLSLASSTKSRIQAGQFANDSNQNESENSGEELDDQELSNESDYIEFEGPQKLRPAQSRIGNAVAIGVFALFWNGIISFVATAALGDKDYFWPLLFLIPFFLAGIGLIVMFVYMLLALTNPKVEIALSNGVVGLGESIDVAWQTFGKITRIREFVVSLEGREEATYTRGTSTYTDKSTFCQIELARLTSKSEIEFGTKALIVPAESMHSFDGSRNKIRWQVIVRGKIPWWPDVNETFEFKVKPGKQR